MKKLFLILLIIFSICEIDAYENDYFEINIPDGYVLESNSTDIYKWTNDRNYISITITENKNNNISSYENADIDKELRIMNETYNDRLKTLNTSVVIENMTKEVINDKYSLIYDMYYPISNNTGYDIYQKGLTITTENYIFTLVYSSDNEIDDAYFDNLINTFNIYDDKQVDYQLVKLLFGILVLLCIILFFLINIFKNKSKA